MKLIENKIVNKNSKKSASKRKISTREISKREMSKRKISERGIYVSNRVSTAKLIKNSQTIFQNIFSTNFTGFLFF